MRARCSAGMPLPVSDTSATASSPSSARRNRQPAAARHRVARVQEQVQEHLLQLELEADRPCTGAGRQLAADLDAALLELVLEQRQHVADHLVEVDDGALGCSAAFGRDRLSRPLTMRAARNVCFSIFSSSGVRGSAGIGLLEQHLRVARDAGQRRVDLVRDAGGEQAERRHLLRDAQLLFQLRALGDVLEDDDACRRSAPPAIALQRHRRDVDEQRLACRRGRAPCSGTRNAVVPVGMIAALRAQHARRRRASNSRSTGWPSAVGARQAVEALERLVPADHAVVQARSPAAHRRATRGCSR